MDTTIQITKYISPKEIENYEELSSTNTRQSCFGSTSPFYGEGDQENWMVVLKNVKSQIIGLGTLGIYSNKRINRKDVWGFSANRDRSVWIDHIEVYKEYQGKGYGKLILAELERLAQPHLQKLTSHRNIYVGAVAEALLFYRSQGYDEIETPETDDDEDYFHVYRDEFKRRIMAKPSIAGNLENEVYYFTGMNPEYSKFEHACADSHPILDQWTPHMKQYITEYLQEDNDYLYYIFHRIVCGSSLHFFDLVYRHLMLAKFDHTTLESFEELKVNDRIVKLIDLAEFFECKITDFQIIPEIKALCDKFLS